MADTGSQIYQNLADCMADAAADAGHDEFKQLALHFEIGDEEDLYLALVITDNGGNSIEGSLDNYGESVAENLGQLRNLLSDEDGNPWVGGVFTLTGDFEMDLELDWGEESDEEEDDDDFDDEPEDDFDPDAKQPPI